MPDLATLIERQAELVAQHQRLLLDGNRPSDGEPKRRGPNDAYREASRVLVDSIDKYVTLRYLERDGRAA